MARKYSRIRKHSQPEFLLQKHISEGKVELNTVITLNMVLSILFLGLVTYIVGVVFNYPYIAGIWLAWGILGASIAGEIKSKKILFGIITFVPTACVVITAHIMNAIYWLFSKTFHKS